MDTRHVVRASSLGAAFLLALVVALPSAGAADPPQVGGRPPVFERSFKTPQYGSWGMAVTATQIFITNTQDGRIDVFDHNGVRTGSFGSVGSGQGQFKWPSDIAVDPSTGELFVVDRDNNRIQVFNQQGQFLRMFGSKGFNPGQLGDPNRLALDGQGHVYVGDFQTDTISKFTTAGVFQQRWNTSLLGGNIDPRGIAVNPVNGWIYANIAGYMGAWDPDGHLQGVFLLPGFPNNNAFGVATDASGYLYIADGYSTAAKYYSGGGSYWRFGEDGEEDGNFVSPMDIDVDSTGRVWVLDAKRVQSFVTCTMRGTPGDDVLHGTSGTDVMCGMGGTDTVAGGSGDDIIVGGVGKDHLLGGDGADEIIGNGEDYADYSKSPGSVSCDLKLNVCSSDGFGNEDVIFNVAGLIGSPQADTFAGDRGRNRLYGLDGDDSLSGDGGRDLLSGGEGDDACIDAGPSTIRVDCE